MIQRNADIKNIVVDNGLNYLRMSIWDVAMRMKDWQAIESSTKKLVTNISNLDQTNYMIASEYLLERVKGDMLLSLVFCVQNIDHPIGYRILSLLEKEDKKWIEPEDEDMAGSIIELSRESIRNWISSADYGDIISYILALVDNGYFRRNKFKTNVDDLVRNNYQNRFIATITSPRFEESFKIGSLSRLYSSGELLFQRLTLALSDYLNMVVSAITEDSQNRYDHANPDIRHYVMSRIDREITVVLKNALENGDVGSVDDRTLAGMVMTTRMNDNEVIPRIRSVLEPIASILLEGVLYEFIMNDDRVSRMKMFESILDVVMLRRILRNEAIIKTQRSSNDGHMSDANGHIIRINKIRNV